MTAASGYRSRALVLLEQKRHADAEQELRKALGEDPNDATTHALLALALGRGGALEEATREAGQAVRLAPDVPFGHYVLASVLADRNRFADSARAAEEALRLDPGQEWARRGIVEAMKARYSIYGLVLRYFLWMGKLRGAPR